MPPGLRLTFKRFSEISAPAWTIIMSRLDFYKTCFLVHHWSPILSPLTGMASVILYYRFLHPKSTEICQRFGQGHVSRACLEREESFYSMGDKGLPVSTIQAHSGFALTGSLPERPASRGPIPGGRDGHHHWLLIRLALKTGDVGRIDLAYGSGGLVGMLDARRRTSDVKAAVEAATPDLEQKCGLAPLSDMKEDFHSASEAASTDATQEDGESLDMESPLGSPVSEFKRSSPEGKSGLGGSPEVNFCPTESSSTLYFSAEPQSPSSASNTGLDRESALQILSELSPISGEAGPSRSVRGPLGRVEPCYTSTPKLDSASQEPAGGHLAGSRRLFVSPRRKWGSDVLNTPRKKAKRRKLKLYKHKCSARTKQCLYLEGIGDLLWIYKQSCPTDNVASVHFNTQIVDEIF